MKVAVIGCGYWGPNLIRNFLATEGITNVIACDSREKRLTRALKRFPAVEAMPSYDEVLRRRDIDAVVLATPVSSHFPLGMKALEAGKHLLVEKPLALRSADAAALVEFADKQGLVLMVDHTFVYTGAVRKIKEYMDAGEVGDAMYFDSVRINLGLFQHDTNVVWDLAAHDLSIMDYLLDERPLSVMSVGLSHFNEQEDIAYITVLFPNDLIAHFHVNWISPVKVRKILIGGTKQMVVYDDMESSDKVKMYNKGVDYRAGDAVYDTLVKYRTGDMFAPNLDQTEALSLMAKEFVEAIANRRRPLTDGNSGLDVVRILEAADSSLHKGGKAVIFAPDSWNSRPRRITLAQVK
jgi:predicted dehydrogenase